MRRRNGNIFLLHHPRCPLLATVSAFLEEIGLRPLALPSQKEPGLTIVERFEDYASEAYAVVLLSSGASLENPAGGGDADPSLLFQAGFLAGKLGRRRVAVLLEDDLSLPAQCSDLLCIPIDEIGIWKFALMRDLVVAGFAVRRELAIMRPKRAVSIRTSPQAAGGS